MYKVFFFPSGLQKKEERLNLWGEALPTYGHPSFVHWGYSTRVVMCISPCCLFPGAEYSHAKVRLDEMYTSSVCTLIGTTLHLDLGYGLKVFSVINHLLQANQQLSVST